MEKNHSSYTKKINNYDMFIPSYIALYKSGEFEKRLFLLKKRLENCDICPRICYVNRNKGEQGYCRSGKYLIVCSHCDHHGEEPPLSGTRGSGTIFLGNCNLRCVFCQNDDISQKLTNHKFYEYTPLRLSEIIIELQNIYKCHNINFVSPSHFVPQIVQAIYLAVQKGLQIPLVYNSNGYDSLETLSLLEGIFDIYLPDLKYSSDYNARKYSGAKNYVSVSRQALKEMYRQVGELQLNFSGIAQKGLLIRHLVLPNDISGSIDCIRWIAQNLSTKVSISLMAQYSPKNYANRIPLLSRKLRYNEYEKVLIEMEQLGFNNSLCQQMSAANIYLPHFFEGDHPFE